MKIAAGLVAGIEWLAITEGYLFKWGLPSCDFSRINSCINFSSVQLNIYCKNLIQLVTVQHEHWLDEKQLYWTLVRDLGIALVFCLPYINDSLFAMMILAVFQEINIFQRTYKESSCCRKFSILHNRSQWK